MVPKNKLSGQLTQQRLKIKVEVTEQKPCIFHDKPRHRQFRRQISLQCILIGKTSNCHFFSTCKFIHEETTK
jgi:HSP20 family molecular chaperone IbpA